MITQYINRLLSQAVYQKDESGYIIAQVPNHQGFFSQGESHEQARTNLIDAIEGVITLKLQAGDKELKEKMQKFITQQQPVYA